MQTVLQRKRIWKSNNLKKDKQKVGFLTGLFGCWHKQLSRPFTISKESYCVCTNCGARRQFNPETLQTNGNFYFPVETDVSRLEIN